MNKLDFYAKEEKFFERYDIKVNPKTGKWNKEFYLDKHFEFHLGKIPRTKCKFCLNPIPESEIKGHGKQFCNEYHKIAHYKIHKKLKELRKNDPNILGINCELEELDLTTRLLTGKNFKEPERIKMKIFSKTKNPKKVKWVPLTTRSRTKKDDS